MTATKKRPSGRVSIKWHTCPRCGFRWEGRLLPTSPQTCDDCRFVDPMFGKRVAP